MKEAFQTKFLIRFDDINESMNWKIWDQIEYFLDSLGIKPAVAVIPKNRDDSVAKWSKNSQFESRYLDMYKKGYEICLHGYDHVYITDNPGIFGLSPRSEFAGVDPQIQREKIKKGIEILQEIGINPRCWIGPNHSYDEFTLKILKEFSFSIILDGHHRLPYERGDNLLIIPTQRWKMKAFFPGLYTVCYHHNEWNQEMLSQFKEDTKKNIERIVCIDDVINEYGGRQKTTFDYIFSTIDKKYTHTFKVGVKLLVDQFK